MHWSTSILLHEAHETAAASGGGGMGVTEIAVVALAAVGLAVGLYLLAGAVEVRPEEPGDSQEPAQSG